LHAAYGQAARPAIGAGQLPSVRHNSSSSRRFRAGAVAGGLEAGDRCAGERGGIMSQDVIFTPLREDFLETKNTNDVPSPG